MTRESLAPHDTSMVLATLQRTPLFASLPVAELERLAHVLGRVSMPADQLLFREDEAGNTFYVIVDGQIAIIKALGQANERLLAIRGAGEFVGEMSLLNGDGLRTASARTDTAVQLLALTRADFDALLHQFPDMAYVMLRVMSARLRASVDATIRDLQHKNAELARAYAELQAAQVQIVAQEALRRELLVAHDIQMNMLPQRLSQLPGFELAACMVPARMVGGDFYDVVPLGPDRLAVMIGDVSGKGVPAALFMALTSNLLRAELMRGASLEATILAVNRHLMMRNPQRVFVTVLCGVLDRTTAEFRYVRAGHEHPYVWDAAGAAHPLAPQPGQPLGMFVHPLLDEQAVTLTPGCTLLLASDGLCEAMNAEQELFGEQRIVDVIQQNATSAQQVCDALVAAVAAHQGSALQSDDLTLLVVRALPGVPQAPREA